MQKAFAESFYGFVKIFVVSRARRKGQANQEKSIIYGTIFLSCLELTKNVTK